MKLVLVLALTWLCLSVAATAHSPVSSTQPLHGTSLAEPPASLVIEFKNSVRLTKVTVTSDGGPETDVDLSSSKTFAMRHMLPAPDLAPGMYLVEWRALAKDGHAMTGSFSFSIK